MAKIEVPTALLAKLGPAMQMDVHWVDVKLKSGKCFYKLVVRGSRYITGRSSDPDGEGALPFNSTDIATLRRQSIWWWPLW